MRRILPVVFIAIIVASCSSADNKVPQIAADFCDCFKKLETEMSVDSKKLFATAAEAADPEKALGEELVKLEEEVQEKVGTELMALGELEDESSELGSCMKKVEKKYGNQFTLDEKKFAGKIIKELESRPGCSFTASLMKLGLKVEENEKKK